MEQLFVIQRYKPADDVKTEDNKKKQFSAALDKLLQQARNRQQLQNVSNDTNSESPRTVIKRKLFRSPEAIKGLKKRRTTDGAFTSPDKGNISAEFVASPTDLTNKSPGDKMQSCEKKQPDKKRGNKTECEVCDETKDVTIREKVLYTDLIKDSLCIKTAEPTSKPKKKIKLFRNKRNKVGSKTFNQKDEQSSIQVTDNEEALLTAHHTSSTKERLNDDVELNKEISTHDIDVNNNTTSSDQNDVQQVQDNVELPEGFTVLGQVMKRIPEPVPRMLPNWLAQPTILSSKLQDNKMPVSKMSMLEPTLLSALEENGVTHFFPVQQEVIPWVLKSLSTASFFRPQDICVSAPTGSGKTLSYVLPVIHAIMNRLVPLVRVLVVLPVKDLASQVFKVFQSYIKSTNLKVALISGHKPHAIEAKKLVRSNIKGGFTSLVDIVVATPGSLMHHIQRTEGFSLHNLRFLVIDEADRMIEDIQEGWLSAVERAIQSKKMQSCQCRNKPISGRFLSGPIIACCLKRPIEPCQKLLFSATLSHDPEKLKMLSLFSPKLFTTVASSKYYVDHKQEIIENFSTPEELTEATITCDPQMKPLTLWYLLFKKHYTRVLCFTNTVESSHRLTLLLTELGDIEVRELSSNLKDQQRKSILNQFSSGKIDILVCSDMLARGMDLNNVQCVICYDPPSYIKTYIHRIGRTARAGLSGTALSLLYKEEQKEFNKLMKLGNRPLVKKQLFDLRLLDVFQDHYQNALEAVSLQLAEHEQNLRRSRTIFQMLRSRK